MNCHAIQKSCYDWIVVVAPIFISGAVAVIGYFQYKVNSHKFRLDLYNRRFTVYEKTLAYFQSYYSLDSTKEFIDSCTNDFIRSYRESVFLFGDDSTVYKTLTELKDTLSFLIQYDRKFESQQYENDEYNEWHRIKESKPDLHMIMGNLEKALLPWLDFKKIAK